MTRGTLARLVQVRGGLGAFQFDGLHGVASEGEGACLRGLELVTNLPLTGKLGWMTPRAGVKTTLAMKRAFRAPDPKRGPRFIAHPPNSLFGCNY